MNKTILIIAYRNIWRRKVRTIIVVTMITLSIGLSILMNGVYDSMIEQMLDNLITADTGHVAIYKKGYLLNKRLSDSITDTESINRALFMTPGVNSFTFRLKNEGMVSSTRYSMGITVMGIVPEKEKGTTNLYKSLVTGNFDIKDKETIIGQQLADELKVKMGDKIVVMGQNTNKEIASGAFRVAGIIKSNSETMDKYTVFINLESAQQLFDTGDIVSQYLIISSDRDVLEPIKNSLQEQISADNYDIKTWKDLSPMMANMETIMISYNAISYAIVFFVIGIGLFNILLISIMERVKEFGIMMSVGTRFSQAAAIILWESLIIGFLGFIIGSVFSILLLVFFNIVGFDLSAFSAGISMWGLQTILRPEIKFVYFIYAAVAVLVSALLSAIWPIRMLKKLKPIQAVHFN